MKRINYVDLVTRIESRNLELRALKTAKAQERDQKLMPRRINSKTVVLMKSKDDH